MPIPSSVMKRRSNYKPDAPINRTYNGPALPISYDPNWQLYNNLTRDQIAWFQAQPEWQNFVSWVALSPTTATINAEVSQATITNALANIVPSV